MTSYTLNNSSKKESYEFYSVMFFISVVKSGWSGPDAVRYQSFDSPDGLVVMESSEFLRSVPLVSGQVTFSTLNIFAFCRYILEMLCKFVDPENFVMNCCQSHTHSRVCVYFLLPDKLCTESKSYKNAVAQSGNPH